MIRAFATSRIFMFLGVYFILCQVGCLYSGEYKHVGFRKNVGSNTDFKVALPGLKEECFYEPMTKGGRFEVSYLVVGHKEIDFYLNFENGQVLAQDTKSKRGAYTLRDAADGTYVVCLHNSYNTFSSVVVHLLMVTYESTDSNTTTEHLDQLTETVNSLRTSLSKIRELNWDIKTAQRHLRVNILRDINHVTANEDYVYIWSLTQCVITVAAALIQVYSIRWLFKPPSVKKSRQGTLRA